MAEDSDPGSIRVRTVTGEQIAVPLPRSKNWADKVPLMTLFAVIFAAGMLWAQIAALSSRMDKVGTRVDEDHDRIVRLETATHISVAP